MAGRIDFSASWDTVPEAVEYRVQVFVDGVESSFPRTVKAPDTSYVFHRDLEDGQVVSVGVSAEDALGQVSAETISATVTAVVPEIAAPQNVSVAIIPPE